MVNCVANGYKSRLAHLRSRYGKAPMRIRMFTTLLLAALLATLSACGTKGALYLPEKPATTQPAAK